jgi:hypothetical protein
MGLLARTVTAHARHHPLIEIPSIAGSLGQTVVGKLLGAPQDFRANFVLEAGKISTTQKENRARWPGQDLVLATIHFFQTLDFRDCIEDLMGNRRRV